MRIVYSNKDPEWSGWLTFGKEYVVLSVEIYDSSQAVCRSIGDFVAYRIQVDNNTVLPCPAKIFEVISNKIPASWIFQRDSDRLYSVLPERWSRDGFWEDYYNDDPKAIQDFNNEKEKILSAEAR